MAKKEVRVWVDGCFDITHFECFYKPGHFNALRQAKSMGDTLVVGVHSDQEVTKNKGPTVMHEKERYAMISSCRWADEVVEDAPYNTMVTWLDKYNIDFCVHGDDITTMADGTDCYQEVKDAGRYKECKRTVGISTTDLVGRLLLMTKDHHKHFESKNSMDNDMVFPFTESLQKDRARTKVCQYVPGSQKLECIFPSEHSYNSAKPSDQIIYVDGTFDLFHIGHVEILKKAKELGSYLVVGIHDDKTVNKIKGVNYPIMTLQERLCNVLSCRYVDEVVIGTPYSVPEDLITQQYKVHAVAHGRTETYEDLDGKDPYKIPKELNICKELETESSSLTFEKIIDRIISNRQMFEARNERKKIKAAHEKQLEQKK